MNLSEYAEYGYWALQIALGLIFLVHGLMKLKAPAQIAQAYGMPSAIGMLHGLVEVAGAILLALNMFVPYVGIVFGIIMLGALYFKLVKWHVPFFAMDKTGWEFDFLILSVCVALILK